MVDPGDDQIAMNASMALMTIGYNTTGLAGYESRLLPGLSNAPRRTRLSLPRWKGQRTPQRLLVCAEQGLGDEIRFASAIPHLLSRGVDVIWECEPRLLPVFQRSFPEVTFQAYARRKDGDRPVFEYGWLRDVDPSPSDYLEAGSLPHVLGLMRTEPVSKSGYLLPDPGRKRAIDADLPTDHPRIGVVWGSSAAHPARARFYPKPEMWRPILSLPGVTFINLQYIDAAQEITAFKTLFDVDVHDVPEVDKRRDLDGAAALAACCDMVVGVSSSVTAMAGAVGIRSVEMVPERTWLPRFEAGEDDERDGQLGRLTRVEATPNATLPDDPAAGRDWSSVMTRTAALISREFGL